jgi:excisionase family DNA binding protein
MTERLLLTVAEAARALSLSRSKLYLMVSAGAIPSVQLGRSRRIRASDLEEFVAALGEQEGPG